MTARLASDSVMPPTPGRDDTHLGLVGFDLQQGFAQGLHRTLDVGLDDQIDVGHLAFAHLREQLIELGGLLLGQA